MSMKIEYSRRAEKDIKALNEPIKSRIRTAIERLPAGDIKNITGKPGYRRLRVGDFRVVFEVTPEEIVIRGIAPRGQAYKGL